MNETVKVINRRRSVRNYSPEPMTEEEKEIILSAAMRAPTAGNLMLYSIIEVADQALKERLAETCDHQPFIAKAPLVLLFAADYQRLYDFFLLSDVAEKCRENGSAIREPREGDLLLACCDALIAAQTAVIAAESLGIGSCYIGDILEQYEIHRDLFDLPPYAAPVCLVCFGRPAVVKEEVRLTPRYGREFIVSTDRYHRLTAEETAEMMRPTLEKVYPDGLTEENLKDLGQKIYFRKFGSEFSVEMSRSVHEMLKNWQKKE